VNPSHRTISISTIPWNNQIWRKDVNPSELAPSETRIGCSRRGQHSSNQLKIRAGRHRAMSESRVAWRPANTTLTDTAVKQVTCRAGQFDSRAGLAPGHTVALVGPTLAATTSRHIGGGVSSVPEVLPTGCRQGGLQLVGPFLVGLGQAPRPGLRSDQDHEARS
jgi:hypothetical protein